MISDTIQKQVIDAMKAKDTVRVSTLRMLNSELKNAKIDKGSDLTEEEELVVVKKEAKKRRDAIEGFERGGNKSAADNERAELAILATYLPEEMADDKIIEIIDEVISKTGATSASEFGKVMPEVMSRVSGQADGKRVADLVRSKLV